MKNGTNINGTLMFSIKVLIAKMSIYLCLLFLGLVSAGPLSQKFSRRLELPELKQLENIRDLLESDDDTSTATINVYTDKLLKNIGQLLKQDYDPMDIADISEKFSKFFVTGEFTLSYGKLEDLSTLYRDGTAKISYVKNTRKLSISLPLAFNDLKFQYDYKVKFMSIGPAGLVDGAVSNVKMTVNIVADFNTLQLQLEKYEITNSGHISVNFHGNLIYDWLLSILSNATTIALKPIILNVIENVIAGNLKNIISTFNELINVILGSST